ncbi:hypothetical protein RvY_10863-2 [Ramazzottius varieornatus]|uniref:Uncharacterized protein n=1 Tax=Ramazzottius varieornatus TaxID=947166 RepID=A0A1D1VE62_RAMVA|nr:hypothetical protein RvY_10863-2 [Ramazzottius varieornatus]
MHIPSKNGSVASRIGHGFLRCPKPVELTKRILKHKDIPRREGKLFKVLDEAGTMWPFPKAQTQWLENMLSQLPETLVTECRKKDSKYLQLPSVQLMKEKRLWRSGI